MLKLRGLVQVVLALRGLDVVLGFLDLLAELLNLAELLLFGLVAGAQGLLLILQV